MKYLIWILLVIGLLVSGFPVAVSADPMIDADVSIDQLIDDGDASDCHDENGWLVAGSGISSTIRVSYIGSAFPQINFVRFVSVENETYGDVATEYVTNAPFETVFSASMNTAGNAPILVQINYSKDNKTYDYYRTVYQSIDHNTPMKFQTIAFESEVTLQTTMNITMKIEDAFGNTVTSLYEDATHQAPEDVLFSTTPYAGSGFYDGSGYSGEMIRVPVNGSGIVIAAFKVGSEAGPKYLIHVVPVAAVNDQWLTITGIANGMPHSMSVSIVPNVGTPPALPADGVSRFYLTYTLFDEYGNPSGNHAIRFTDDVLGDTFSQRTNGDGQVRIAFGPYETVATFTIHAETVENTSVTVDQVCRFTDTSPDDMLLTANPKSMPSADVANAAGADIYAKVTDECGNGVSGEEVLFWILPDTGISCSQVAAPVLAAAQASTNEDGIAAVHFTPGAFVTDTGDINYCDTVTESCTVVAMWGAKTQNIELEWRNYPYLRVETNVDPATVNVGDPVDVTIRLIGDGWAFCPKPIDVMLCSDRSGSMSRDTPTRMDSLKGALTVFNGKMEYVRDRVGMTSFGNDATLDLSFTPLPDEVDSEIDALAPQGWTSMRYGLKLAITEITKQGRDDAVHAVILLSDGDYNWYGDPLARGTGYHETSVLPSALPGSVGKYAYTIFDDIEDQDLSVYAANHNITLYTIALGDGLSEIGKGTLRELAQNTGGTYYYAPEGDDLTDIYSSIAGELKTAAGVNTRMDVMFNTMEVNNVTKQNTPADPILEYVYENGVSTVVKSWNEFGTESSPNVRGPLTLDQRDDWLAGRCLNFDVEDIGTICLNQTWQAVFRMNVTQAGNINIFGTGSSISFNDGAESLSIPKTYVTGVPNLTANGIEFSELQVYDLKCVEAENGDVIRDYLTMNWNLNYSGISNAEQALYYQNTDDCLWVNFGGINVHGPVSALGQSKKLYVGDLPPGKYHLRVWATAEDAADSIIETMQPIEIGGGGMYYILLE